MASVSRRAVIALLLAGGVGAGALLVLRGLRSRVRSGPSPWLRIEERALDPLPQSAAPVLWLALATLLPEKRTSILDEIEAAMASVEARANPLLVDVVEEDLGAVLDRNQPWFLPICTAAGALLAPGYEGPDGFRVEVLAPDSARNESDLPAWKTDDVEDPRARRARFLAWPASRSLLVRMSGNDARRVEVHLREACADRESAIALVLDRRLLLGKSPDARLDAVLGRLAKAQKTVLADERLSLVPSTPAPGIPLIRWVILDDGELLVVPKLGALSPPTRFASEVRRRIDGTGCTVVAG